MSTTTVYFSDYQGQTRELHCVRGMPNAEYRERFGCVEGLRFDSFARLVGRSEEASDQALYPVTRQVAYKRKPSLHECNAKCLNGSVRGTCECRCGGRNHGRGLFTSLVN